MLPDDRRLPTRATNLAAPSHTLLSLPAKLGQQITDVHTLESLSFLAACCDLIYEDMRVVEAVVTHRCGGLCIVYMGSVCQRHFAVRVPHRVLCRWQLHFMTSSHTIGRLCREVSEPCMLVCMPFVQTQLT